MDINDTLQLETKRFHRSFKSMSDLMECHDYVVEAQADGDKLYGFAWIEWEIDFSSTFIPLTRHYVGLLKPEYAFNDDLDEMVPALECGVQYILRHNRLDAEIRVVGDLPEGMMIEKDEQGRIVYCGMWKDGQRHGFGSAFNYTDDGGLEEVRGVWRRGEMATELRRSV